MNKLGEKIHIRIKRNAEKIYKAFMMSIITIIMILNSCPAYAEEISTNIIATGTEKLFTDIGKWLLTLAPIAGSVVGVYFFIRRGAADEMDQKKWNDRIKTTVISTIGAVLVSTLIILIASYYGKTVITETKLK